MSATNNYHRSHAKHALANVAASLLSIATSFVGKLAIAAIITFVVLSKLIAVATDVVTSATQH
jgi:hypothetical protein